MAFHMKRSRGITSKQYLIAAAVTGVISLAGAGLWYYHSNSPKQLSLKAQIAMDQGDMPRAVEYLSRALAKNSEGEVGLTLRRQIAKALIEAGRESDARQYISESLAKTPTDAMTLDLLAESHRHLAQRKLDQAPKPLTETSLNDIYSSVAEELAALEKLPRTPRNMIAEAQLHRLYFVLADDQIRRLKTAKAEAEASKDAVAVDNAQRKLDSLKDPAGRRDKALELLQAVLKEDPQNIRAAEFLVQYHYQDRRFREALAFYRQFQANGPMSQELVINAANAIIADAQGEPDYQKRYAKAQKELETYIAGHANEPRQAHLLVAIGLTLVEQGKLDEALAMAQKAIAQDEKNLDAQLLQINCKVRQKKTQEALSLVQPLTNTNSGVPQVWYLLGLIEAELGKLKPAEEAFRKALALHSGFTPARRALLVTLVRMGNADAAATVATHEIREDRYFIPAWSVAVEDFRKRGQYERARAMLSALAEDPDLPAEARAEVVQLFLDNGMAQQAEALAAKLSANDPAAFRVRAAVAAANGKLTLARELLSKALAADPEDVEARLEYVDLLLRSDLAPDARAQLDQVVAGVDKEMLTAQTWNHIARNYLVLRLPQQALGALTEALAREAANEDARRLQQQANAMLSGATVPAVARNGEPSTLTEIVRQAVEALGKKDYQGTLTLARTGLSRDSANVALHHLAARALAGLGQRDQAVEEVLAAARTQPDVPSSFDVFVELFPTADAALKGLGYGNSLQSVNPALGNWAMGRLAEIGGDRQPALRYYRAGLEAVGKTGDPAAARDVLYRSIIALHAAQNDAVSLKKDAEAFAAQAPAFLVGVRLLAADQLRVMGDTTGALEQLDVLVKTFTPTTNPPVVLAAAQRYLAMNRRDIALATVEKQVKDAKDPAVELLDAQATLLAGGAGSNSERALAIRQQMVAMDPQNPKFHIALAEAQALAGDDAAAFKTLEQTRALGETGKDLAANARLRLLVQLGLLKEASNVLAAGHSKEKDDFATDLAIGQAWMQLGRPEDARSMLATIPTYAAEYPSAVTALATLDAMAPPPGKHDAAIAMLKKAMGQTTRNPAGERLLATTLFQIYLRAGKSTEAFDFAQEQAKKFHVNTPPYRDWMILAAAAAREGYTYEKAIAILENLDADSRKAAAPDLAILYALGGDMEKAAKAAAGLNDAAPSFAQSTMLAIAGKGNVSEQRAKEMLATGSGSAVYAALAATPAERHRGLLAELAKNPRAIPGDVDALLALGAKDRQAVLRQLAQVQRLLEMGWSTSALWALDRAAKDWSAPIWAAEIQRYQALADMRKPEAKKVLESFAAEVKEGKAVPPGVRVVLAGAAAAEDRNAEALAVLEPLASLKHPMILSTIAGFYEKLGQVQKAVAIHEQIRQIEPGNLLAANNLAYTLCMSAPGDKQVLARAASTIQGAIEKAPDVPAFQDTLGWIEILSGKPEQGVRRIARVLPSLRLQPAVHYHLGIGYSKIGQPELAKLHLQNVQYLAKDRPIPEIPLATEALKSIAAVE